MKIEDLQPGVLIKSRYGRTLRRVVSVNTHQVELRMENGNTYPLATSIVLEHWKITDGLEISPLRRLLDRAGEKCGLSDSGVAHAYEALKRGGVTTPKQLREFSNNELAYIPGIGDKSLELFTTARQLRGWE